MRISAVHRPTQHTCQNLGCYHAGSRRLNLPSPLSPGRSAGVSFRHVGEPQQRAMDCAILLQPPASREPGLPYSGHPDHPALAPSVSCQHLFPSPVALRSRPLYCRMDFSIHWPCLRGQAAGVFSGLAISAGRRPLVVGQDPRESLSVLGDDSLITTRIPQPSSNPNHRRNPACSRN